MHQLTIRLFFSTQAEHDHWRDLLTDVACALGRSTSTASSPSLAPAPAPEDAPPAR